MSLRQELQMAQMYTHTWGFIVIIMLVAMAVQASRFHTPIPPVMVLSILTILVSVATALSMAMHDDYDKDGQMDNEPLGDAEGISVVLSLAFGVLAFIITWMLNPAAPFKASPMFGYVLFGLIGSAIGMGILYFKGSGFTALHRKVVEARGGTEGWSHSLEKWGFYHVQWHLCGGFFAFLLVLALFVVLKARFNSDVIT
jgi:hypothetical protein